MKRYRRRSFKSKRAFKRTAKKVHPMNNTPRGGYRL